LQILQNKFKTAYVGVTVGRRVRGIRLNPYIEIRGKAEELETIRLELLKYSIGCTIRNNFLRIQGIQNCSIISPFVEKEWFKECMKMFEEGLHLTQDGRDKIMELIPRNDKSRKKKHQIVVED